MTWSLLARDPQSGELGVIVATRFFAVGALCPRAEAGVGALATQALIHPLYAPRGVDALRSGTAPEEALAALLAADAGRESRQCHILSADGRIAQHTGSDCVPWCGAVRAENVSVAGNMLAGPRVVEDTLAAFLAAPHLPMALRLIHAMEAGEAAGGDARGKQSAALIVTSNDPYPDLDLRVDDHADPLAELRRLHGVAQQRFVHFRRFLPGADHPGVFDRAVINAALAKAGVA
ncbi:DUF1028 domain-containing protein [Roseococcus sp. SDR]|uniref:DUF1028 domain-containing protein n=1 Tax=Roseococcus sp. SDR TaxID=2835532 RepID=UPI001BD16693|nr:DUF1028 domain-containing protein [Roseococcus sp. SDR]MBS7790398.1 DUF1028 domain-containing protein [Roseococcus sp. SDR]MBV1845712.1 DUF1028 domain-containing protein [Roseococcus sp. SDR]